LDEARAATQTAEEAHRGYLVEARLRQEQIAASMRERESELRRSFNEQAEQSALSLSSEMSDLRQRLTDAEASAARHDRTASQLQVELATVQGQLQTVQADRDRAVEDLRASDAQLARSRAEHEASQHQTHSEARRLSDEHRDAVEQLSRLSGQSVEKHRQLEDAQKLLAERLEELHRLQKRAERAETELADCRALRGALEDQRTEAQRGAQDAKGQLEELSWRLEVATQELERSRQDLHSEQERARVAQASSQRAEETLSVTQDELRRRESEAGALMNMLSQAQRQAAEARHDADMRSAALEKESRVKTAEQGAALEQQLAETSAKVREMEAEASKARRAAEEAAEERIRAGAAVLSAKESELEARAKAKVDHLKHKYEMKISKLYQRLGEREAHELRLRSLLENEVNVLHHYNRELDNCCHEGRGSRYYKKQAWEDLVVDRMKGMADKAERRILKGLSRADLL